MPNIIEWLISTPLGLAAVVLGFVVLFTLIAFLSERKTRRLYPDRNRRGTKAKAKAKAKAAKAKAREKARREQEKAEADAESGAEEEPEEDEQEDE
jgi:predicted lipid-binding transport protein (Tim44 family)